MSQVPKRRSLPSASTGGGHVLVASDLSESTLPLPPLPPPPPPASSAAASFPTPNLSNLKDCPLPEGWDVGIDFDGKPFFIDHKSKTTSWIDPRDR